VVSGDSVIGAVSGRRPGTVIAERAAELQAYVRERYPRQIARGGTVTLLIDTAAFSRYVYRNFSDVVDSGKHCKHPQI
jgi:hypothetical protein